MNYFFHLNLLLIYIACAKYVMSTSISKIVGICGMPDGCEWETEKKNMMDEIFVCSKIYNNFNTTKCDLATKKYQYMGFMFFTLLFDEKSKKIILNNSFQFYKFAHIIKAGLFSKIKLVNLKGFDVNLALELSELADFEFYDIDFDFYSRDNKIIRTCEEYKNSLDDIWPPKKFIFNANSSSKMVYFTVKLINSQFRTPVCPLVFENTQLYGLWINNLVKSYYKKNVIKFLKVNRSINCTIKNYQLENFYGLDISKELINEKIFEKTSKFQFDGVINSIQTDLFKSIESLKSIQFNPVHLLEIVRKQGIQWIKNINYQVRVNLSDFESVKTCINKSVEIGLTVRNVFDFRHNPKAQLFYDEDFCLFVDYPFHQLVIIAESFEKTGLSCTTLWLIQYYSIYYETTSSFELQLTLNKSLQSVLKDKSVFTKCHFETRLRNCNKSQRPITKNGNNIAFDLMIISQFLLVIFTPIVSFIGIITNLFTFLTIVNKKNRSELKEKHYIYMAINSISNILILVIQIISLINECQYPFGIFCSSVRKYKFVQYFKIIVVETCSSFLRLVSNFTYVAFSINRISLVVTKVNTNNKGFFERFSTLSVLKYLILSSILSFLLALIKAFRFRINNFMPIEAYPYLFFRNDLNYYGEHKTIYQLLFVFDAIYNIINYVFFAFINLVFDLILMIRMRAVLKEKMNKFKNLQDHKLREKKQNESDEAMRKVTLMVILNALVNFAFKIPISITSLNDLRLLISTQFDQLGIAGLEGRDLFKFPYTMKDICYLDEICWIFNNFGNFLFIVSLTINIFFYLKFDKKFNIAFYLVFSFLGKKKKATQKAETSTTITSQRKHIN